MPRLGPDTALVLLVVVTLLACDKAALYRAAKNAYARTFGILDAVFGGGTTGITNGTLGALWHRADAILNTLDRNGRAYITVSAMVAVASAAIGLRLLIEAATLIPLVLAVYGCGEFIPLAVDVAYGNAARVIAWENPLVSLVCFSAWWCAFAAFLRTNAQIVVRTNLRERWDVSTESWRGVAGYWWDWASGGGAPAISGGEKNLAVHAAVPAPKVPKATRRRAGEPAKSTKSAKAPPRRSARLRRSSTK